MDRVRFDEDASQIPRVVPRSADNALVRMGLAVNHGQARLILFAVAVGVLAIAIYLFISAVPKTPILGNDVPRHGEVIPPNRSL